MIEQGPVINRETTAQAIPRPIGPLLEGDQALVDAATAMVDTVADPKGHTDMLGPLGGDSQTQIQTEDGSYIGLKRIHDAGTHPDDDRAVLVHTDPTGRESKVTFDQEGILVKVRTPDAELPTQPEGQQVAILPNDSVAEGYGQKFIKDREKAQSIKTAVGKIILGSIKPDESNEGVLSAREVLDSSLVRAQYN